MRGSLLGLRQETGRMETLPAKPIVPATDTEPVCSAATSSCPRLSPNSSACAGTGSAETGARAGRTVVTRVYSSWQMVYP